MMLSKKQIGQVTYPLHQDGNGRFSYPELIELVFGKQKWLDLRTQYGLKGKSMESKVDGASES